MEKKYKRKKEESLNKMSNENEDWIHPLSGLIWLMILVSVFLAAAGVYSRVTRFLVLDKIKSGFEAVDREMQVEQPLTTTDMTVEEQLVDSYRRAWQENRALEEKINFYMEKWENEEQNMGLSETEQSKNNKSKTDDAGKTNAHTVNKWEISGKLE